MGNYAIMQETRYRSQVIGVYYEVLRSLPVCRTSSERGSAAKARSRAIRQSNKIMPSLPCPGRAVGCLSSASGVPRGNRATEDLGQRFGQGDIVKVYRFVSGLAVANRASAQETQTSDVCANRWAEGHLEKSTGQMRHLRPKCTPQRSQTALRQPRVASMIRTACKSCPRPLYYTTVYNILQYIIV